MMYCQWGEDFLSSLGIVLSDSVWNGGHNGGNGQHNVKDLQEMGKDCYRGALFVNICKCFLCHLFDCCSILTLLFIVQIKWEN